MWRARKPAAKKNRFRPPKQGYLEAPRVYGLDWAGKPVSEKLAAKY